MPRTYIRTTAPGKVIAAKGARQVGKVTSGERGKNVTVICAMNACGTYIPPIFIFPRKRMAESLLNGAPPGSKGLCTDSGWTDSESFVQWLHHFCETAKPSKDNKQLIILDGHHSHKSSEAIELCIERGIELITLPPHCTHKMQPLDKTFFKAFKSAYNAASTGWMVANAGRRITMYEICQIFATAYNKCASIEKAVNGFRSCGLWPLNSDVFGPDDFAAADELECAAQPSVPQPSTSQTPVLQPSTSQSSVHEPLISQSSVSQPSTSQPPVFQPSIFQTSVPQPSTSQPSVLHHSTSQPSVPQPSTSQTSIPQLSSPKDVHSPRKVLRALSPMVTKRLGINRKTEKAEILTVIDYKEKRKPSKKTSSVSKKKKSSAVPRSKFANVDYCCIVCDEPFASSMSKEKWIQCGICQLWSHELCTSGDKIYVCDFCA
ncbi:Uncharacterised protein r2_g1513 [Pycnogonum litorale]